MKIYYIVMTLIVLFGCEAKKETLPGLTRVGALREIMHEGKIQARVSLDTLTHEHLYGLGALDSLRGEFMVLDGEVFQSHVSPMDSLPVVSLGTNISATLMVSASVQAWDTVNILPDNSIESVMSNLSMTKGFQNPFPFMMTGTPELVAYHIINFDPSVSHMSDHKRGAFLDTLKNESMIVLGFYSDQDHGIFTHHDSNVHLHFINQKQTLMGHVDHIEWGNGEMKILIPKL